MWETNESDRCQSSFLMSDLAVRSPLAPGGEGLLTTSGDDDGGLPWWEFPINVGVPEAGVPRIDDKAESGVAMSPTVIGCGTLIACCDIEYP